MALAITVLLGFGALAVDLSFSQGIKLRLQTAADAAALAASQQLPSTTAATTAALDLASKNAPTGYGTILRSSDVTFGTYDATSATFTTGTTNVNAVKVVTRRTSANGNAPQSFFASAIGATPAGITTTAIAYRSPGPSYCVYVLDPSAVSAFSAKGGGSFQAPNCNVQINSSHNKAATTGNGSTASAKSFSVVGATNGTFSPAPQTGQPALADPLSSLPEPTAGTCSASYSAAPGTYCGSISVSSSVTLPAGIYYFKNAQVTIGAGANVTGSNVMWFFDANSSLDFASNGTVNLTAPTSGTYKGVVMFQSRSAASNNVMKITGTADFLLDGTVYMPKAQLQLTGNSNLMATSKSGYFIVNQLAYTGSSTFSVGAWGGAQALGKPSAATLVQ